MNKRRVVGMRIKVNHVDVFFDGAHDRVGNRVIATHHHQKITAFARLARHFGGVIESLFDVSRPDVHVTKVGDKALRHLNLKKLLAMLRVVVARAALPKAKRMLPKRPRPAARAGHKG